MAETVQEHVQVGVWITSVIHKQVIVCSDARRAWRDPNV